MITRYPTHCNDKTCASCVEAGDFIFLAHHAGGFDKDDVAYQSLKTLNAMKETLNSVGASLTEIVQLNLYLKNIKDLREACDVFYEVFGDEVPARMTLTTDFFDDRCLCMMDAIAYKKK
ncbi:hypothetical protein AN1V17_25600 [Vallitalea sediminicola]